MPNPKKPTRLKVLQGTFRKDRAPENEPEFKAPKSIKPPEHLDGLALVTWQDIAPKLRESKILTNVDLRCLEMYCISYANSRAAAEEMKAGPTLLDSNGNPKKNPAYTAFKEQADLMAKFGGLLGLDPQSRGRISVPKDEKAGNPFTQL